MAAKWENLELKVITYVPMRNTHTFIPMKTNIRPQDSGNSICAKVLSIKYFTLSFAHILATSPQMSDLAFTEVTVDWLTFAHILATSPHMSDLTFTKITVDNRYIDAGLLEDFAFLKNNTDTTTPLITTPSINLKVRKVTFNTVP